MECLYTLFLKYHYLLGRISMSWIKANFTGLWIADSLVTDPEALEIKSYFNMKAKEV